MSVLTLLEMAAAMHPDRVALTSAGRDTTYAELHAAALATGRQIAATGAQHSALLDVNTVAFPLCLFGSAAAGVPFAPLNYRLATDRLDSAVARLSPVVLVRGEGVGSQVSIGSGDLALSTSELPRAGAPDAEAAEVDQESPAVLLFTSGTTGEPKIAVLRHRHLFSYVTGTVEFGHAEEDEAIMVSVPNYHIAGISSLLSSVYSGRRIVQLESFTPEEWVRTAAEQRVTHAMVVPTMLGRILDVIEERGETLPALRHLSYGGGRMPRETVERAMDLLSHVDLVNAYGLTETSSTVTVLGPEDHRVARASADPAVRGRLASVGCAVPGIELEVRDDGGRVLPAGASGEIFVRGDQVAGEYTSHSAVDADGWYCTRDRGRVDADGYLYLEGRADDVIVRGGENISPEEVEDVLVEHAAVRGAAVVGVPDTEWGERVEAVLVLADDSGLTDELVDDLTAWVRNRLRSTRVPARFHATAELPFNETGKMLRRVVRQELAAMVVAS